MNREWHAFYIFICRPICTTWHIASRVRHLENIKMTTNFSCTITRFGMYFIKLLLNIAYNRLHVYIRVRVPQHPPPSLAPARLQLSECDQDSRWVYSNFRCWVERRDFHFTFVVSVAVVSLSLSCGVVAKTAHIVRITQHFSILRGGY